MKSKVISINTASKLEEQINEWFEEDDIKEEHIIKVISPSSRGGGNGYYSIVFLYDKNRKPTNIKE